MSEIKTIRVTADDGLLIGNVFVPKGKTANVDFVRADDLVKAKVAELTTEPADFENPYAVQPLEERRAAIEAENARLNAPASELAEFPAYSKLNKGGLTTLDGLKGFITENPNDWQAKLDLTDDEATALGAKLKPAKTKAKE